MFALYKYYGHSVTQKEYWDNKYAQEKIAENLKGNFTGQRFWPLLEKNLTKQGKYLDVGCGLGGWVLWLKQQRYQVEGVDISTGAIEAIIQYDPTAPVKVGSLTEIPHPNESFDGVFALGTLEYLEGNVQKGFTEVYRVLKPGGWFLFEVPIQNAFRKMFYIPLKRIEGVMQRFKGNTPTFSNYLFNRSELQQLLQEAGFELVAEQAHELPEAEQHYGLYIDWPFLRSEKPYQLNTVGRLIQKVSEAISPWIASTGTVIVARKKS